MSVMRHRRICVLMNPKSGLGQSLGAIVRDVESHWGGERVDVSYQISRSVEDGQHKTEQAVRSGAETVLVVGGDGMVNSIGGALLGSGVALGVIPAGSGNGFARHFGIPLFIGQAIKALASAECAGNSRAPSSWTANSSMRLRP
ncbi:MAG: acylglycerol kinase family protein [bacterium]